ncbi:unnamed protein product, partial [Nesidiocoris tenuis]
SFWNGERCRRQKRLRIQGLPVALIRLGQPNGLGGHPGTGLGGGGSFSWHLGTASCWHGYFSARGSPADPEGFAKDPS